VNRLYGHHFLQTLKYKSLAKLQSFPDLYDANIVRNARTLREFDNVVTAPLHGYRDTDDYWTRASSKPDLGGIAVPTLIVHARNDPFLPGRHLPEAGRENVHEPETLECHRTDLLQRLEGPGRPHARNPRSSRPSYALGFTPLAIASSGTNSSPTRNISVASEFKVIAAAGPQSASGSLTSGALWQDLKMGIEKQVKEHPGRTLLIAVGLGYLLGKALRK
jgi:hypothetical protein